MRLRAISYCSPRILALIWGSPSSSLCSCLISCLLMLMFSSYCRFCQIQSNSASRMVKASSLGHQDHETRLAHRDDRRQREQRPCRPACPSGRRWSTRPGGAISPIFSTFFTNSKNMVLRKNFCIPVMGFSFSVLKLRASALAWKPTCITLPVSPAISRAASRGPSAASSTSRLAESNSWTPPCPAGPSRWDWAEQVGRVAAQDPDEVASAGHAARRCPPAAGRHR